MNQVGIVKLSDCDIFKLIAIESKKDYAWRRGSIDTKFFKEGCVKPLDGMPSTSMQIKDAEITSRKAIELGKNALIFEYLPKVLIYEVVEDERKGLCTLFLYVLFADCIKSRNE